MWNPSLLIGLGLTLLAAQASAQGCMADIKKNGLMVGTSPDYPPYESLDSNNNIIGFDIDLIRWQADGCQDERGRPGFRRPASRADLQETGRDRRRAFATTTATASAWAARRATGLTTRG